MTIYSQWEFCLGVGMMITGFGMGVSVVIVDYSVNESVSLESFAYLFVGAVISGWGSVWIKSSKKKPKEKNK